jgi:hypothetical protein
MLPLITVFVLILAACDTRDPITAPDVPPSPGTTPSLAIRYSGGIPFGLFVLPTAELGSDFNGTMVNARVWLRTGSVLAELAAIKARGGKVIMNLTGGRHKYLDEYGHFSLTMWKQAVDAFKMIAFTSYITDGTIIAHYLIDEPNDASNWGGVRVPPATLEEMARYSKQLWPNMATIARTESTYLAQWSGSYRYLDAAWAQYAARKGDPGDFIKRNVADAKLKGLALVTGLNILMGDFREPMSPSLIKSAGSALLSSWYPCAFISWRYDTEYLATPGVRDALKYLRAKALQRTYKSCRS